MNKIGIFTIIKNEQEYLDEWISYHIRLGIDKIYVFEDNGSLSHKFICDKYDSVVFNEISSVYKPSVFKKDKQILQVQYMISCLNYIKNIDHLDWVAYIDVDEFVTLENECDDIHSIMNEYSDYNIVSLQWKNFGASGHITKPIGNCIDNFTVSCKLYAGRYMSSYSSSKLFFNMYWYDKRPIRFNMHIPYDDRHWCKTDYSTDVKNVVYNKIYIRHYITKSLEEFCWKIFVRGQFNNSKELSNFFLFNPDISSEDLEVKAIIDSYYEKYMCGELEYHLKL